VSTISEVYTHTFWGVCAVLPLSPYPVCPSWCCCVFWGDCWS